MFKKIITFLFLITSYSFLFTVPVHAQTKTWTGRCVSSTNPDVPTIQGIECLFANVLRVIMYIAGLVFFFVFISNAFTYITSGSDDKKLAQINSSITMAIVGLLGVVISWLIIKFIGDFTGVNVVDFAIPGNP